MRFLADGPSIPDELLVARDEGRVVFFCGAGVSRARAGLVDFFGLAEKVTKTLGLGSADPVKKLIQESQEIESRTGFSGLISADRIFAILERQFLIKDIQADVAKALKPSKNADLSAHRIMLDLARGPDGKVRLVTTNFDLMFESVDANLQSWIPPQLPNPERHEDFDGIIHLHGRVNKNYSGADGDGFILSSSEFGRAYLSEAWATQFIQSVLNRFFVVFVGYTADDPPVQYLLEALNRSLSSRGGLYAFQSGVESEARSRWLHKGVQPIAYDRKESHSALWDTLTAWAIRAHDPDAWYENAILQASKGPEVALPHERGQIMHIVSTLEGARKFGASVRPPPADWLCVFDRSVRYSKPSLLWTRGQMGPFFDPFEAYGLDSDHVPPKIDPNDYFTKRDTPGDALDCFAATRRDYQDLRDENLPAFRGHWADHMPRLSTRLERLIAWICTVANQPAALWWASGQTAIHPDVRNQIRFHLEHRKLEVSATVRRAWRYLFEARETQKSSYRDWYVLKASIDLDGWTNTAIRELAKIYRPRLTAQRPWNSPKPPENTPDLDIREMLHLDVEYADQYHEIQIADEYLPAAVREIRQNLEYAVSVETELGGVGLRLDAPIDRDLELTGHSFSPTHGLSGAVLWYVQLFKTLVEKAPALAQQEYFAWRTDDEVVFARLRIWVCGDPRILSANNAADLICNLTDEIIWASQHQRDLLVVLKKRWRDFPTTARKQIETRLLNGPLPWDEEAEHEYAKRRAWSSLERIHWLSINGCEFACDLDAEQTKLRDFVPEWKEEYAEKAGRSREPRSGDVETDKDYTVLLGVPLSEVLNKSLELSGRPHEPFVRKNPFAGLASARPVRALTSLTRASRHEEFPKWAWQAFLHPEARKSDKARFCALVAARISKLPADAVSSIIYAISEWILVSGNIVAKQFPAWFDRLWLHIIAQFRSNPEAAKSSRVRGNRKPEWVDEALNAPVGKLAQLLINDPNKLENGNTSFAQSWIRRVEDLITLEGDLRRHALVIFAFHLDLFFAIDPIWADKHLINLLDQDGNDQDAIWAGFLWRANVPDRQLYVRLKPYLLNLSKTQSTAVPNQTDILAGVLLAGWGSVDKATGDRFVTDAEMRDVLINVDDDFRAHTLWQLESWSSRDEGQKQFWSGQVPVFLSSAWPRQKAAKSPRITAALCDLVLADKTAFSTRVDLILPFVTKIDSHYVGFHRLEEVVSQSATKLLDLLIAVLPEDVAEWPYGISDILEGMEKADESLTRDRRLVELKRRWSAR